MQIARPTLSSQAALVANTECLESFPRAPPSCWREHLPLTVPAWLPISGSGSVDAGTEGQQDCRSCVGPEAAWVTALAIELGTHA